MFILFWHKIIGLPSVVLDSPKWHGCATLQDPEISEGHLFLGTDYASSKNIPEKTKVKNKK